MSSSNLHLHGKVALITGGSRGIGAVTAQRLAVLGVTVVINFREKKRRAEDVKETILRGGGVAVTAQADLTRPDEVSAMMGRIRTQFDHLDLLVLNASGGLEKDVSPSYAMELNRDAQLRVVDQALPLMQPGSRIIFITTHMAHFYGIQPVHNAYEPVASSKKAGEVALRARIPDLKRLGICLIVVSGDLIQGTITVRLLERESPGLVARRREHVGHIPTIDEFANAIVAAAVDSKLETGATVFVGRTN